MTKIEKIHKEIIVAINLPRRKYLYLIKEFDIKLHTCIWIDIPPKDINIIINIDFINILSIAITE